MTDNPWSDLTPDEIHDITEAHLAHDRACDCGAALTRNRPHDPHCGTVTYVDTFKPEESNR